jgi:hypothetical protein
MEDYKPDDLTRPPLVESLGFDIIELDFQDWVPLFFQTLADRASTGDSSDLVEYITACDHNLRVLQQTELPDIAWSPEIVHFFVTFLRPDFGEEVFHAILELFESQYVDRHSENLIVFLDASILDVLMAAFCVMPLDLQKGVLEVFLKIAQQCPSFADFLFSVFSAEFALDLPDTLKVHLFYGWLERRILPETEIHGIAPVILGLLSRLTPDRPDAIYAINTALCGLHKLYTRHHRHPALHTPFCQILIDFEIGARLTLYIQSDDLSLCHAALVLIRDLLSDFRLSIPHEYFVRRFLVCYAEFPAIPVHACAILRRYFRLRNSGCAMLRCESRYGLLAKLVALIDGGSLAARVEAVRLAASLLDGPLCLCASLIGSEVCDRVLQFFESDDPELVAIALKFVVQAVDRAELCGCTAALAEKFAEADLGRLLAEIGEGRMANIAREKCALLLGEG